MKELITTQLIEEYQKKIESKRGYLRCNITAAERKAILNDIDNIEIFIDSLQSKQSEERQNIVDAVDNAIKTTLNSNTNIVLTGEDYFNKTFKQEQK
jgi:hypothetical protein